MREARFERDVGHALAAGREQRPRAFDAPFEHEPVRRLWGVRGAG